MNRSLNPYLLPEGNVQIAFSGGLTSAYMLHQILEANGGLPSRVETLTDRFGLPLPLVRICEAIFERLPDEEQPVFFREVGEALRDGQDLSRVHWAFLADTLRHLPDTDARDVVAAVIDGMDRLARGEEWPEATAAKSRAERARVAAVIGGTARHRRCSGRGSPRPPGGQHEADGQAFGGLTCAAGRDKFTSIGWGQAPPGRAGGPP